MILKAPNKAIKISHCLFDMDGLLLDTERVYTEVSQTILSRYDKTYSWALKSRMMGLKERDAAELFVRETEIEMTAEEYLIERNSLHEAHFPSCTPLPGVMELVSRLHALSIPIAVATSSHTRPFSLKTQNNTSLFSLFNGHIVTGDHPSVKHGKPAPDIFLVAEENLGFKGRASEALVFEDAASGVRAGLNAGMNVVWVRDPNLPRDIELEEQCFCVLESMKEFDLSWVQFLK
ncbi:HAD-like domain-containing protein [Paraphysoderma sedebokerense]|nr:HAD-like domain-containing protein [Paraphysoderma sedebokerense]